MIHHVAGAKHESLTRSGWLSQKRGTLDVIPDKQMQNASIIITKILNCNPDQCSTYETW